MRPLYLSNECINNCQYCGFSRDNPILRVTLSVEEVLREARALKEQGFRNILLVSGEHPKFVSERICGRLRAGLARGIPQRLAGNRADGNRGISAQWWQAGADGLVVYQETYDRQLYAEMHTAGPKRDFELASGNSERAYAAGFRRLGIGALLRPGRLAAGGDLRLAAHAAYLLRHCWKAQLTISLPRLRPCAGEFQPPTPIPDRDMTQVVCALRLFLPDAGLVLSTREPARLRDGLIPLGITMISAGSHTEPGGYTGAGREKLHYTKGGRIVERAVSSSEGAAGATGQFDIADVRSSVEVAALLQRMGYEPVWKDWDSALTV